MVLLADSNAKCECGSDRFQPTGHVAPGDPCICVECGRTFRVAVSIVPVPWSYIEHAFVHRPHALEAFEWNKLGAQEERLEALSERSGRFAGAERAALVIWVLVLVAVVVLLAVRS